MNSENIHSEIDLIFNIYNLAYIPFKYYIYFNY